MIIYDKNNNVILDILVDDDSYRYRSIMQTKKIELHYSLSEHVELPVASYIDYQGERYTLWYPENFQKQGTRNFEYKVTFGGNEEILKKYKYKLLSDKPYKLKFPLTAKPRMFIELLVDNLNLYDKGWSVGTVIEATEKLVSINHESCLSILGRLAQEFNTEYEIIGKTIHFRKVEKFKDSPVPLSYGKGNGFVPGVGRANQGDNLPVEILYVQGGERNIDYSTYKSQTLLLPKSQELEFEDRRYKTDSDGMYVTRADKELASYNEDSYDASNFYPSRVGSISKVDTEPGKDTDGKDVTFYNIYDSSIPEDLNFEDCLIAGQTMTVIFQSGRLAGREFDVKYIHAGRKFELVSAEQDGMMMPNISLYPEVGDTYAVFNITLPTAYICDNVTKTGASWDMFREAVRYLREHEEQQFTFSGELDGIYAKKNWLAIGGKLVPGGYVDFSDTQFQPDGILIRITGVTDYINDPHRPNLELSNTPVPGFLQDDMGKLEGEEVKNEQKHKEALSFTLRRWIDAINHQNMLEKAFTDYGKGQSMSWLRTLSVLVGHESLQFRFVDRIATTSNQTVNEVDHAFNYDDTKKIFTTPAGIIQHMTLGIDSLSPSHKGTEYKFWNISAYTSPFIEDTSPLYLYIKCSKSGQSGSFLLSREPKDMDNTDGYYYFLTGALSDEVDVQRSFATVYGFSEIGPGWMRLNKIISPDGTQYWDMLSKAFRIGDDNSFLSFDKVNGLILKGTMYQSPSGEIDYPEVDRGSFSYGIKYYPGDKVAYGGNVYKCIAETTGTQYPSNQNYWKMLVSKGTDGQDGTDGRDGQNGRDGYNGQDGVNGADAPIAIYRGEYSSLASYCGTPKRVDIVKHNGKYYVARTDNNENFNVVPTNTSWWSSFGAQFESVATNLLFAEMAYIKNLGVSNLRTSTGSKRVEINENDNSINFYMNNQLGVSIGTHEIDGISRPSVEFYTQDIAGVTVSLSANGLHFSGMRISDYIKYGSIGLQMRLQLPSYSSASIGEWYEDGGFVKVKR